MRDHYVQDELAKASGLKVWHIDGIPWHDAPLPPRFHWCWAQTRCEEFVGLGTVERCPCGAIRISGTRMWDERNRTRRDRRRRRREDRADERRTGLDVSLARHLPPPVVSDRPWDAPPTDYEG
jgi:hypothetical protein